MTKPISEAARTAQEQSRRSNGQFGEQTKPEPALLDLTEVGLADYGARTRSQLVSAIDEGTRVLRVHELMVGDLTNSADGQVRPITHFSVVGDDTKLTSLSRIGLGDRIGVHFDDDRNYFVCDFDTPMTIADPESAMVQRTYRFDELADLVRQANELASDSTLPSSKQLQAYAFSVAVSDVFYGYADQPSLERLPETLEDFHRSGVTDLVPDAEFHSFLAVDVEEDEEGYSGLDDPSDRWTTVEVGGRTFWHLAF